MLAGSWFRMPRITMARNSDWLQKLDKSFEVRPPSVEMKSSANCPARELMAIGRKPGPSMHFKSFRKTSSTLKVLIAFLAVTSC